MKIFCNSGCKESWKTDRRYGLIYGSVKLEDGSFLDHYDYKVINGCCPYCGGEVVKFRRFTKPIDFYMKFAPKHQWFFPPKVFEIKKFTFAKQHQINGFTLKTYKKYKQKEEYKKYWKFVEEVSEEEYASSNV